MNCADVELRLIDWIYGELSDREEASLREHVVGCDSCRRQGDQLRRGRQLLELAPASPTRVDLGLLYRRAAARSDGHRRRWRLSAWAASAAALLVAVLALGRLRIECHADYLLLSWGGSAGQSVPVIDDEVVDGVEHDVVDGVENDVVDDVEHDVEQGSAAVTSSAIDPWPALQRHAGRLASLDELVQLVVVELDSIDRRHRQTVAGVERKLRYLERQTASRWDVLDRDVRAVYQLAQNSPETQQKGTQP